MKGRGIAGLVGLYVAWLLAVGILVSAAVERHPYSFYTLLRWICCPIFAYSAFAAYERNRLPWAWIFGTLALLYNPIFHVHLDRSTWIEVNWVTAAAIVIAAITFWRDWQKSPSENAEHTVPPVPPSGHSESKGSATPKKFKAIIICGLVVAFGIVALACWSVAMRYHAFANDLSAVQGIHIGDPREEVKYRLGFPPEVLGPVEKDQFGDRRVYTVSGKDNDVNKMPSTTKVEDYDEWVYEEPSGNVRLTVEFNKSGLVESLELFSDNRPWGWGPIAGLHKGDSEEKVLRWFGQPSGRYLDGVSKKIEYRDLGIEVLLTKGRVYMITIKGPQEKAAVFRHFIRTLL
jgi:hypothetical protein